MDGIQLFAPLLVAAILCAFVPCAAAQSLAVFDSGTQISNNSTVYITSTNPSADLNNPDLYYTPSMPALGVAYDQRGGPCGQIDYTINIAYDGNHFRETANTRDASGKNHVTQFPAPVDYDNTSMPPISGTVICNQQVTPIEWNDFCGAHYGGTLTINWHLDSDSSINGTFTLNVYGVNPSNLEFDAALGTLVNNYVPQIPVLWLEHLFSLESAAAGGRKGTHNPPGQYHQFNAVAGYANAGLPNDTCGCPEGIGVGQIDDHTINSAGHVVPAAVKEFDMFWNWWANLSDGVAEHLVPFEQSAIDHWYSDESLAGLNQLQPYPPQSVTNLSQDCQIEDAAHLLWAYELDGYNTGHNARFTKVTRNAATNTYSWVIAHSYFKDLCNNASAY
ncbi:MAG: hypothetical protein ABSE51_11060 [Terracidiphilus sp.]